MTTKQTVSRRNVLRTGMAGLTVAALPGGPLGCGCPCDVRTAYQWNNAIGTAGVNATIATPASLASLVELVRSAEASGQRVRMTGSGHSFSDVAFTDQLLLRPTGLQKVLAVDWTEAKPAYGSSAKQASYIRVESGITIEQLNSVLDASGRGLENMGGYDAQTIVGAATTGTHGSGLGYGPIASQIVSIELVTTEGRVLKIEPADGLTDPSKFAGSVHTPLGRVIAELQQDDRLFNAALVSLGCLGIVYAVTLRVEPKYWLEEVRTMTTWAKLSAPGGFIDRLQRGQRLAPERDDDPEYYEIYVNPYPPKPGQPAGAHACLLTKRYKRTTDPGRLSPGQRLRGKFGTAFLVTLSRWLGQGTGVARVMNAYPDEVPGILGTGLEALEDKSFIGTGPEVFHLGEINDLRAYASELAFDIKDTVPATQRLFEVAAEMKRSGLMHPSPPSLRFVKSSNAHLAMMHGRRTCTLEIGMLVCVEGGDELLKRYERLFIDEFAARPHWGLDLNVLSNFEEVERLYPAATEWRGVLNELNYRGTFDGKFTDRLGISQSS